MNPSYRVFRVFGSRRSGHHAIIIWIIRQLPGKVIFLSNLEYLGEDIGTPYPVIEVSCNNRVRVGSSAVRLPDLECPVAVAEQNCCRVISAVSRSEITFAVAIQVGRRNYLREMGRRANLPRPKRAVACGRGHVTTRAARKIHQDAASAPKPAWVTMSPD